MGKPQVYIRSRKAIDRNFRGSMRSAYGFAEAFPINQGTREGCILLPLLFSAFFADAVALWEMSIWTGA